MNAGPAGTRSPHLDLEDLIAEVTGQAIDDQAREHLAHCEHCRTEANRWDLVAAGVRGLAVTTPEAPQPARPQRTRPRIPAGPRKRTVLAASAAAALVLLGAVGYATTRALTRHASGAVLTAVNGCSGVELASGTLEQVNGTSLIIQGPNGQRVTVTTTASTTVSVAGGLLSDVTDGASVIVIGPRSGGTVTATSLTVGRLPGAKGNPKVTPPPGWVVVRGTVSDAGTAGFTVITSGGTRVPVTTTAGTFVVVPDASLGQLRTGAGLTTAAAGHAGPHGTLSAKGVVQQPTGGQFHVTQHIKVAGCSPASLAAALNAVLVNGG
jgi:hypothetical protein